MLSPNKPAGDPTVLHAPSVARRSRVCNNRTRMRRSRSKVLVSERSHVAISKLYLSLLLLKKFNASESERVCVCVSERIAGCEQTYAPHRIRFKTYSHVACINKEQYIYIDIAFVSAMFRKSLCAMIDVDVPQLGWNE